ncbi:protein YgfX [Arsukibacterium indicum]|uniref:Toxin CptA n=1 Tax=Arsukibacterium indicum TaxID=2848612 RepID=A0ABS6MPB2_9GAMM|nr:protein YgfX [Arsukibacterium indicum]MBV2130655.1 hypothetical protein [Arsukibacterium indicum]
MSGCNIAINPSVWRRYGLLVLAVMLFALVVSQPLTQLALWLAAPFVWALYWYGLTLYRQSPVASGLNLHASGQLNWWQSKHPSGQLIAGCLVSEFALLLRWQCAGNKQHSQWLVADQLSAADYRALARQLNQFNWQCSSAKPDS